VSFRPKDILQKLADAGADPDSLLILEHQEKVDYLELGLPTQGVAKALQVAGVLKFEGKRKIDYRKRRNVWGKGTHYPVLRDHYKQNRKEFRKACGLPL
jgi:hypothetical protein